MYKYILYYTYLCTYKFYVSGCFFSLTHELPSQTLYEIRGDCNQAEAVRMIEEAAEAIAARGPKSRAVSQEV